MASEMYGQDALASLFSPSAPANVCLYGHPRPLPTPAQTKTANTSFTCAITARPSLVALRAPRNLDSADFLHKSSEYKFAEAVIVFLHLSS